MEIEVLDDPDDADDVDGERLLREELDEVEEDLVLERRLVLPLVLVVVRPRVRGRDRIGLRLRLERSLALVEEELFCPAELRRLVWVVVDRPLSAGLSWREPCFRVRARR